jgi:AbrB family looped-hinge helix DNA binding protein
MSTATITSKGQITVPKEIREALGVRPGDRLAFHARGDGTVVVEAETVDLMTLRGVLKPRRKGVTVEAMNEAVRRSAGR